MTKKEELFVLIQSLSKSEKRHFSLYCKAQGGHSHYLEVFQFIGSQITYDEDALRLHFHGQNFLKQLHVMKNYLRSMILKSLRNFHGAASKDAELKDCLRNVEILFFKELFTHAEAELNRAEKIAVEYEIHTGLYEVHSWQRRLAQHKSPSDYNRFGQILTQQEHTVELLANKRDYEQMIVNVGQAVMKSEKEPVALENLLEDPDNAKSLEAKVMHYNAAYFRDIQQGDSTQSEERFYDLLEILESQPHRLKEDPGLYASSINNFISYFAFQKRQEEALALINRAKTVYERVQIRSEKKTLLKQILRTYSIELEIYRDSGNVAEHLAFFNGVEAFVVKNKRKMPEEYLETFTFQIAFIHFMLGNTRSALKWTNAMLSTKWKHPRLDITCHSRFLNLMLHFELQNIFVLRYYVDNARRFLKKHSRYGEFEKMMISLFSQLGKAEPDEQQNIISGFVEPIRKHQSQFNQSEAGLVDYVQWAEKCTSVR
jgi:tetratricopeptide (TPR) repeat protein